MAVSFGAFAQLPSTTVKELSGKPVKFNTIFEEGKVTLVSFWATWCVPCKAEIKNIKDKLEAWQGETDFNFMTISIDDSRASAMVKAYTRSQGWTWPTYLDPNSDLKRSLNFQNVPFTIIVDQSGNIVYKHTGYEEGGENELYEKVKELVGEATPAEEEIVEEAAEAVGEAAEEVIEEEPRLIRAPGKAAPKQEASKRAARKAKRANLKTTSDH